MLRSFMIGALVYTVLAPDRNEFQGAGVAFRGLNMGGILVTTRLRDSALFASVTMMQEGEIV